ncbi:MAG: 30S ribosomal protein S18, partial [Actinobacteria bacterium]|nr:30S ribosomal protein S18 [Actinomycetota bacterium]
MRASDKIPLKKVTPLLKPDVKVVDYKDVNLLRKFVSDRG